MSNRNVMTGELEPPAHTVFWYAVFGWSKHHEMPRFIGWPPLPEPDSWEPFFRAILKAPDWAIQLEHWARLGMRCHAVAPCIMETLRGALASDDMRARMHEALGYFAGRGRLLNPAARRAWLDASPHKLTAPCEGEGR